MIRDITVVEYPKNGGFHLSALYRAPFDDMYDYISHPTVFPTKREAERFCEKVRANPRKIDLRNWVGSSHPCAGFQSDDSSPAFYCPVPAKVS